MQSVWTAVHRVHENSWHVRGHAGFVASLAMMLAAAVVTDTFSADVLVVLAVCVAVTFVVFTAAGSVGLLEHELSLLLWPVAVCSSLLAFSTVANFAGTLLSGLIVLAFLFIGLCQPPGRGLWFVLPAIWVMVEATDLDLASGLIRVPVAVVVWVVVSELPARLLRELHEQREVLSHAARTDALTGLMNRTDLRDRLQSAGRRDSVALLDLDHFKRYNDEHGHVAGDRVLADFASAMRAGTRHQDLLFRYGGEEFLVIFPELSIDDAATVLRRFAIEWSGHPSGLTFSAGVAPGGAGVVREADVQLYRAKAEGRNRVVTRTPSGSGASV